MKHSTPSSRKRSILTSCVCFSTVPASVPLKTTAPKSSSAPTAIENSISDISYVSFVTFSLKNPSRHTSAIIATKR